MSERNHVSRSSLCIMRHDGTGTAIDSDIDGVDLPPLICLGFPTLVTLKIILYQYAGCSTLCFQQKVSQAGFIILILDGTSDLPPLSGLMRVVVTECLQVILYKYFGFICIMAIAPPQKHIVMGQKATPLCHSETENIDRGQ